MRRAVDHQHVELTFQFVHLAGDAPAGERADIRLLRSVRQRAADLRPGGEAGLRVDVEQHHAAPGLRPGHRQMGGQRGLAGPALLLRDGDDPCAHDLPPAVFRVRSCCTATNTITRHGLDAAAALRHGFAAMPEPVRILPANDAAIDEAAALLRAGRLVAFPTETVYGLGGDATDDRAVAAIFAAKGRPSFNPLISHVPDVERARELALFTPLAE